MDNLDKEVRIDAALMLFSAHLPCSSGTSLTLPANLAVPLEYCPLLFDYGNASQNYCFYFARTQLRYSLGKFRVNLGKHWLTLT